MSREKVIFENSNRSATESDGSRSSAMAAAILAGDSRMESEFYRRYHPIVLSMLQVFARDAAKAEDLTHDVLIKVLLRLREGSIDHPERLTSFVLQTARFSCIGWYRQSDNQVHLKESMEDSLATDNIIGSVLSDERARLTEQLVGKLEIERDREVLRRAYLKGESKRSVCDALMLSDTHYDRVISRARQRLKALVGNQDEDIQLALAT